MSRPKSVHYNLQISIDSLCNECVLNIESPAPFNGMSIGEKFFPSGDTSHWLSTGEAPRVLYVVDIAHFITESDSEIFNQMLVALSTKVPYLTLASDS